MRALNEAHKRNRRQYSYGLSVLERGNYLAIRCAIHARPEMPPDVGIGRKCRCNTLISLTIDIGSEVVLTLITRNPRSIEGDVEHLNNDQQQGSAAMCAAGHVIRKGWQWRCRHRHRIKGRYPHLDISAERSNHNVALPLASVRDGVIANKSAAHCQHQGRRSKLTSSDDTTPPCS